MKAIIRLLAIFGLASGAMAQTESKAQPATSGGVLDFKMKDINGADVDLAKYKGKVVLLVNVASRCGYTPQYEQLEALHEKYGSKGLAIIGVPCNDFGKQEPGTEAEIKDFCSSKFNVKFDMLSKVSVKGEQACPLYKFLTSPETNKDFAGPIKWNFTKFLIDKSGKVVSRYESAVKPDDESVIKKLEEELAKK